MSETSHAGAHQGDLPTSRAPGAHIADPAPLGLAGFALTTFVLSMVNSNIIPDTLVGGALGAVAGHQIGKHSVSCGAAPRGVRVRAGCRWVHDRYNGRTYNYQVCRNRNGHWRPV